MMLFRIKEGEGLLIGPDCVRVFVSHVEMTPAGPLIDIGVHAPKHTAVNRDALPTKLHRAKQEALESPRAD